MMAYPHPSITHDCNGKGEGSIEFRNFGYEAPNGPFDFTWFNENGETVVSGITNVDPISTDPDGLIKLDLIDVAAGTYTLIIMDKDDCQGVYDPIVIDEIQCSDVNFTLLPNCGQESNGIYEICVGASIEVIGSLIELDDATIESISWIWSGDAHVTTINNTTSLQNYSVFWGTPGEKEIKMIVQYTNGEEEVIVNNSVIVGTGSNVCDTSLDLTLCIPSSPCYSSAGPPRTNGLGCLTLTNGGSNIKIYYKQLGYSPTSVFWGAAHSNEVVYKDDNPLINPSNGGHIGVGLTLQNPIIDDVHYFLRTAAGCSNYLGSIPNSECESCSDLSIFPLAVSDIIEAFDCEPGDDGLVDVNLLVSCGAPPYQVTWTPGMPMQSTTFYTGLINLQIPVIGDISPDVYNITITDNNDNSISTEMFCGVVLGIGGSGDGYATACNSPDDSQSPAFAAPPIYEFCKGDPICIDYDVTETENGLYAVYVKNYQGKMELFQTGTTTNAVGQFCFEEYELNTGSNLVELVATDKGECNDNFTTQVYTINISDASYQESITELEVINAYEEDYNNYFALCTSSPIQLQAEASGMNEYKWYRNGFLEATSADFYTVTEPGMYVLIYFDANDGPCGQYTSQHIYMKSVENFSGVSDTWPPMSHSMQNIGIGGMCSGQVSISFQVIGGSGDYQVCWDHLPDCSNDPVAISMGGDRNYTITDLCTGIEMSGCIKVHQNRAISDCSGTFTDGNILDPDVRLRVSPTVYEESTTLEVELDEPTTVNIRTSNILGTEPSNVANQLALPAGTSTISYTPLNPTSGIKVFVLEAECISKSQLGIQIAP